VKLFKNAWETENIEAEEIHKELLEVLELEHTKMQCQDSLGKMQEDFRRHILEYINIIDFLHRMFSLKNSEEPGIFRGFFLSSKIN